MFPRAPSFEPLNTKSMLQTTTDRIRKRDANMEYGPRNRSFMFTFLRSHCHSLVQEKCQSSATSKTRMTNCSGICLYCFPIPNGNSQSKCGSVCINTFNTQVRTTMSTKEPKRFLCMIFRGVSDIQIPLWFPFNFKEATFWSSH
jgi:hypothetical protein